MSTQQPPLATEVAPALPAKDTPPSNFSRPTTANEDPQVTVNSASTSAPAPAPVPSPTPIQEPMASMAAAPVSPSQPAPTEEPQSYNDKLNAADRYWKFKFGLSGALVITGLIGIGCFAWIMSSYKTNMYSSYDPMYLSIWPSFITWSLSIAWCFVCIATFLTRRRTVQPGLRVTVDLLLWLAFLVTALFAMAYYFDLTYWGPFEDGYSYGQSSSRDGGSYVLESNNTWVWEQDSSYINIARDCNGTLSSFNAPSFNNCAEQDAFVNKMWHEKNHRMGVTLTGVVCQWFGFVLEFVLFVWACVDTHRHRRSKVSQDAEKLAAGIVQTMIQHGAVIPPPGQAQMRQAAGQSVYYMLPPQQGNTQQQPHMGVNMQPPYHMLPHSRQMTAGQFYAAPHGNHVGMNPVPSSGMGQPRYS